MSIVDELARLDQARNGPALQLVNHKWASLVFAVLRVAFSGATKTIRATRLHHQVDAYLEELDQLGWEIPPHQDGRSLCLSWMQAQWLKRVPSDDGDEAYELTSHTLAAQRLMEGLSQERSLLSESRLTTILEAVRRAALEANPDRDSRLAALDEQIDRLSAERDRIADGGELREATDERMLNAFMDISDLIRQLPGEFRRVEESVDRIHRAMIQDFRAETRPKGEILDAYLERSHHLVSETEEGRAFEGALTILSDESLLTALKTDLRAILDHPFAQSLSKARRLEFLESTRLLREGLHGVQVQQHKASRSLADHLAHHHSVQEREVTAVLTKLQRELEQWMQHARPRDTVPMPWMPAKADVGRLRTRFYDPVVEKPTAPLEDVSDDAPEPPSRAQIRRDGGPRVAAVRAGVSDALRSGRATTLGAAFNELDAELRRPVELFGLAQLATSIDMLAGSEAHFEAVTARRPDGTRRHLTLPVLPVTAEQIGSRGGDHDG
jgi:hypothetical protein